MYDDEYYDDYDEHFAENAFRKILEHDENFTENELVEALEDISQTRRPTVFFRGKTLTHDELVTLFLKEEPCLRAWGTNGEDLRRRKFADRDYYGRLGCCLQRRGFGWETSMVLADGSIYGSLLLVKYPKWDEYIPKYAELARRNPFLDMVIGITDIDENPCYFCELVNVGFGNKSNVKKEPQDTPCLWCKDGMCYAKLNKWFRDVSFDFSRTRWNFKSNCRIDLTPYQHDVLNLTYSALTPINVVKTVRLVIHIQNGEIRLATGDKAKALYMEYDGKYADPRMYIAQEAYFYGQQAKSLMKKRVHFNNAFMRECCAKLCYVELWDEVIVPKYMIPFKDEDVDVVTKEFLITEWDKAFGNTTMCYENLIEYQKKYAFYE